MAKYKYIVKTKKGEIKQGRIEAPETEVVENLLREKGYLIVNVEKVEKEIGFNLPFFGVSLKDKALFIRQLATMLDAGISMSDALNVSISQTSNNKFKEILNDINEKIESGYSLSKALMEYPSIFDNVFVAVVQSGEATGKLPDTLSHLADQLEEQESFSSKFKGVLAYPVFILFALIAAVSILMIYVVPQLESIFENSQMALPLSTRVLLSISRFIGSWWWLILLLIVGIIIGVIYLIRVSDSAKYTYDRLKLKLPVFGSIIQQADMVRFSNMMSLLLGTGIPILRAIKLTSRAIDNFVYRKALRRASEEVERGIPLSTPLEKSGVFPNMVPQMIKVGEESGQVLGILDKLSKYYKEEVDTKVKMISSLLEPIIIVVLGLAVGFVVFSIIIPIYQISMSGI
jgi:type IV pilus assembly protein PilC